MLKRIPKFFKKKAYQLYNSIAFYPILLSIGFLAFGFFMLWLEYTPAIDAIENTLPSLIIRDAKVAITLLSVLIGGIISLTVFSFTMVMGVLGQASSNFSPRLLPGLVSDKRHQLILGSYLGTLLYCLLNLIFLGSEASDETHFGFAIMIAAIFGVLCLALFVSFIHNISASIQIHRIIENVFDSGCRQLTETKEKIAKGSSMRFSDIRHWYPIKSLKTGNYKGFDASLISADLWEKIKEISVVCCPDTFVWEGDVVLKVPVPTTDEERTNLLLALRLTSNREAPDGYYDAMVQLMEISVKAMSPGINDPGTAIAAIRKLGQLFARASHIPPMGVRNHLKFGSIAERYMTVKTLLNKIIVPIRQYSKSDKLVLAELIVALCHVRKGLPENLEAMNVLTEELDCIEREVLENFEHEKDRRELLMPLSS